MQKQLVWPLAIAILFVVGCKATPETETAAPETAKPETKSEPTKSVKPPTSKQAAAPSSKLAASSLHTEEVTYDGGGIKMKGYLAYAKGATKPRPGVLVVHEWWGHNEYVRKRARMLAEMGYTAFAVDMYGDGKNTMHPADAKKFMQQAMSDLDSGVKRFEAAKKLLEAHPSTDPTKTAAIGYCFGGGVVLHMARVGIDLAGVASFHGSLDKATKNKTKSIKSKLLVLNGAADPFVPRKKVKAFKEEMAAAKADMKFIDYPGALHAFTNPGATAIGEKNKIPLAYSEDADKKSWKELETFLAKLF